MIKEGVVSLLGFSFFSIWLLDVGSVCVCVQVCAGAELLRENIVLMLLMIVGNQ